LIIWLDAQLSPLLAVWLSQQLKIKVLAVRDLGLQDAKDMEIFNAAKESDVIIMTKDSDFLQLLYKLGPPPKIIWITTGNTSNEHLKQVLAVTMPKAIRLLGQGEPIVEISSSGRSHGS
jgi:predicted nuclease of predicted toxin-antitoxin system